MSGMYIDKKDKFTEVISTMTLWLGFISLAVTLKVLVVFNPLVLHRCHRQLSMEPAITTSSHQHLRDPPEVNVIEVRIDNDNQCSLSELRFTFPGLWDVG